MKKILITIGLVLSIMSVRAQIQMANITFKTADGKVIPADKLDSVKKALGPNITYGHSDEEPNVMYLGVRSTASQKAEADSKKKRAGMIGQPAPSFDLTDINGKRYELSALKGKVIVLNFWFIGCGACVAEMPDLNKIKAQYGSQPVVFLALANDKADALKAFKKTHDFQYAIIPDARNKHNEYGIYACPVSMVIDSNGLISFISETGEHVESSLPEAINAALK